MRGIRAILLILVEQIERDAERLGEELVGGPDDELDEEERDRLRVLEQRLKGVRYVRDAVNGVREIGARWDRFAELVRQNDPDAVDRAWSDTVEPQQRVSIVDHRAVLHELEEVRGKLSDAEHAHDLAVAGRESAAARERELAAELEHLRAQIRGSMLEPPVADERLDRTPTGYGAPFEVPAETHERHARELADAARPAVAVDPVVQASRDVDSALDALDRAHSGDGTVGEALDALGRASASLDRLPDPAAATAQLTAALDLLPTANEPAIAHPPIAPPAVRYSFRVCAVPGCARNAIEGVATCADHTAF